MKRIIAFVSLLLLIALLAGCGETISGMVKDTKRIGAGVRKVFIRDTA